MLVLKRRTFLITLALLPELVPTLGAAATDDMALSDAIRVLAREKSEAEQYAVIVSMVREKNRAEYPRGMMLYADAKSTFDGLIEQLKFNLLNGNDPTTSDPFKSALRNAVEKRVAFTAFVSEKIVGPTRLGKSIVPNIITIVPQLITAITDAGLAIWKAFHASSQERRNAILRQLDELKWQPFGRLAPR